MNRLALFAKAFLILTAAALIAYAVIPGANIDLLLKLLALDVGLSLLIPFAYPHYRGVKSGDSILVFAEAKTPLAPFRIVNGIALENKRVGEFIKIALPDGKEIECRLVAYAGILTPARAKIEEKGMDVKVY